MAERHVPGQCQCGVRITRILDSAHPTCRADGSRFVYDGREDKGWCIFRCDSCFEVIDQSWTPLVDDAPAPGVACAA